jgi:hypothetical protein
MRLFGVEVNILDKLKKILNMINKYEPISIREPANMYQHKLKEAQNVIWDIRELIIDKEIYPK